MTPSDRQGDAARLDPEDAPGCDDGYSAILAAVMETARGRWFLAEFARRNRHADTRILLDALARLEAAIAEQRGPADSGAEPAPAPDPERAPDPWQAAPAPLRAEPEAQDEPEPAPAGEPAAPHGAAAGIFALSFEEKLALFS